MKYAPLKKACALLVCGLVFAAASVAAPASSPVDFIGLGDDVWIHRSYAMLDGYKVPSNGLILETAKASILIDTAWDDGGTEQILAFIKETVRKPIAACIITHSHDDRAGGLKTICDANIPVYMSAMTFALLGRPDHARNYHPVLNDAITIDGVVLQIDYFGAAHAPDNITVWEPKKKLLFGGCLVKSLGSRNLGSIVDADLESWPIVLRKLRDKYPGARIVVPGHGEAGDKSLIDLTLKLLGE